MLSLGYIGRLLSVAGVAVGHFLYGYFPARTFSRMDIDFDIPQTFPRCCRPSTGFGFERGLSVLNHCLEWDKFVLRTRLSTLAVV